MKVGDLVRFRGCGHRVDVGDLALVLEEPSDTRPDGRRRECAVLHQKTGKKLYCNIYLLEKVNESQRLIK